ncbi:Signal recognition particle receptor FtsY [Koleobacter methoxysyntrophicus]|uniref:Signal recognition particle receptor FtsY n=1 Tax=Koleobacter methoxysyntrophicus TaxID=2751313 RepID=A0A8A0RPK0_9FIRM|nr:signal recognition particle-docking protein FtsY [Koleobacter methoxysyntrophicus]MDI3540570.1 fused signal recognition particle receptor [Thermosediminibacterales bacterium]MDK2901408.1 fused signal recognition particle receptor [Thermosediminibacterales bacterium]QSQ09854.1 Signal recognition particle receptor FtsY [Koleobacter methoxysyntrophicus]
MPKIFFEKLKDSLLKTKKNIIEKIEGLFSLHPTINDDFLEELEEILIYCDIGVNATLQIIEKLKDRVKESGVKTPDEVVETLKTIIRELLETKYRGISKDYPLVIMVVGVNGVGKTTTIGKLAYKYKKEGKKVLLAAGDTFRAAAVDQLEIWSQRAGINMIKHSEGSDPAAVIYDAIYAAKARNVDVLICDTAGRLHNKKNLMEELKKIKRVIMREFPEASKETLLVIDATTGQNALAQARLFKDSVGIDGIALTKLDGTAKGGIIIAVALELDIPVKLVGIGENIDDLQEFSPEDFVNALF